MCLVEIKPAAEPARDDARHPRVGPEDRATTRPPRSRSSSPPASMPARRGHGGPLATRARTSQKARAARAGVPAPQPPGRLPDLRSGRRVQAAGLLARAPAARGKRMHDEPIHKPKAVVFGPTIVYDAERCIMCTRCVRFWTRWRRIRSSTCASAATSTRSSSRPGRQLDHDYTFMTEHVCPVGALTTKDFRFKARVWFLRSRAAASARAARRAATRYLDFDPRTNKAYRYRPRDNEAVNKYWMCDEGMLSYRARARGPHHAGARRAQGGDASRPRSTEAKKRLGDVPKRGDRRSSSRRSTRSRTTGRCASSRACSAAPTALRRGRRQRATRTTSSSTRTRTRTRAGVQRARSRRAKPFAQLLDDMRTGRVSHVIALGGVTPRNEPEDATALGMLGTLVVIAAHEGALTEPRTSCSRRRSWAEHDGTYVNRQGIAQLSEKALASAGRRRSPPGSSPRSLATALGLEVTWTKLKDVREPAGRRCRQHAETSSQSRRAPAGAP